MCNQIMVSILCIAYNHEKYIRQCLNGFVMQKTNFKYEVLVHDDASTDKTADIIREYEEKYPDLIKPIYQTENQYSKGVKITMDIDRDISNYHVIIVEDIIDTGRTLNDVVRMLKARNPISLRVVTLLDKPERRVVDFTADMSLFTIPDHFVIGYGLDCGELYRNLPYIAEYGEE